MRRLITVPLALCTIFSLRGALSTYTLEPYRIPAAALEFRFVLRPVVNL